MAETRDEIGFRGGPLLRFGVVASTMDVAKGLPASDLVTTVVATAQTAGRGRFDRTWVSPSSGGLYLTVRIPWTRPLSQAPLVSVGAALALARVATACGCSNIVLKWPNDLLLGGAKAAGILAEMASSDTGSFLLVGVGINVSIPQRELSEVGQPAIALSSACGVQLDPERVLFDFLSEWSSLDQTLESSGFAPLAREFRSRSDLPGRRFLLSSGATREPVQVKGIRDDGALEVVRLDTGETEFVFGGELLPIGSP